MKDFVKKIKQEDARFDMRKKQFMKQAERIVPARAKAQAAASAKDGEVTPAAATPPIPTSATTPALSTSGRKTRSHLQNPALNPH